MRQLNKDVIYGIYSDEEELLSAVRLAKVNILISWMSLPLFLFMEWKKHLV